MNNSRLILALIVGAIGLALASCSSNQEAKVVPAKTNEPEIAFKVILISGFESDPTASQIAGTSFRGSGNSGIFQMLGDLQTQKIDCQFFNWNGTDAGDIHNPSAGGTARIVESIAEVSRATPETRYIFVGHSWGAHTILEVAKSLEEFPEIQIHSAFVIDPSSLMRGERMKELPTNVPRLTNYYTGNMFCWGQWKDESRVENIALGDSANGFNEHVDYGAALDTNAHTHAEWDEKIHADICSRIGSIVGSD
jgi:pimeloyl-ACP methyl ester carboxylesterase